MNDPFNDDQIQVRFIGEEILLSLGPNAIRLDISEAAVLHYQLGLALRAAHDNIVGLDTDMGE